MPVPSNGESSPVTAPTPVPAAARCRPDRRQLLVSVRNVAEMRVAADFADIVDFKEPAHGPLAAVDPSVWEDAVGANASRPASAQLSAALGEFEQAATIARQVPAHFSFAKVGPSGFRDPRRLSEMWRGIRQSLPSSVELVAVAYADFERAGCVSPETVASLAAEQGIQRCLIDTFTKDGRSTLDWLDLNRIQRISERMEATNTWWTLAGSLQLQHLERLREAGVQPDCLGVRGAVCADGRVGTLDAHRVRLWRETIEAAE